VIQHSARVLFVTLRLWDDGFICVHLRHLRMIGLGVTARQRENARAGRTRSQGGEKLADFELAADLHDRFDGTVEVRAGVGGADLAAQAGGALGDDGEAEAGDVDAAR
jgi:hypothetical protein